MDTYQGSIFDPTSLHKYLYANANPVTYSDPTGNFADAKSFIAGFNVSTILEAGAAIAGACVMAIGRNVIRRITGTMVSSIVDYSLNDLMFECIEDMAVGMISSIEFSQTYLWEVIHTGTYFLTHPNIYTHRLPNKIPKGRKYQEAFAKSKYDVLKRSYVKMTYIEAVAALTVDINLNKVISLKDRFMVSKDKVDKIRSSCDYHIFGIYTHDIKNAAALAAVFGSDMRYGSHAGGLYHFHDGGHLTHIWFGVAI